MEFRRFKDFLREKEMIETHNANKEAMNFDTKMRIFHNRFPNGDGEKIVQAAGYKDIRDFLHDPDEKKKWTKLRIPGQRNYVNQ